ncbi:hypothetical protein KAR91_70475 [Candidatus Pacearchaeota archaeon]|nr:hypothetical protein [Candidatus Pacearchaeota archaeon]
MIDPLKAADKIIDAVDDNVYSEQESQIERTERLRIDMQSDNPMAKIIRPVVTLMTGLVWSFAIVFSFFKQAPPEAIYSASAVFTSCVAFYFHSRRQEKIAAKKTDAAIKIEALKTKHELKQDKKDSRAERREERKK